MDPKPNLNNDLSDIICDKDYAFENKILKVKLEETEMEITFRRGEVQYLTYLLNAKIQTFSHNFKTYTKKYLLEEFLMHKYNQYLAFKIILAKEICQRNKITI